jgi:hypothetical protein
MLRMTGEQMSSITIILVWSLVAHLIADWLLQNDWIARNKSRLSHPAMYVHGLIHLFCLLIILPIWAAAIVSILHVLIDTRKPLIWWGCFFKQTSEGGTTSPLAIWRDQVLHLVILAIMSFIIGIYAAPSGLLAFLAR